ncbi:MAG: arylsulfatase, partial [Spirochaetaceae bacterium]|nr:arylsulfatase [Spirochaetaceae bacterium]
GVMGSKPNVVYFLVDDMGYGDVSCLNPRGRIATPQFDRLAREGMVCRDAHSSSAVCSPSRYGVLTGRYNWRTTLQRGIVSPYGPPLIDGRRLTVGKLLQGHGYHCGAIGKWHLGMDWPFDTGARAGPTPASSAWPSAATEDFLPPHAAGQPASGELEATERQRARWREFFARRIAGGPTARGFDYYFGVDVPNWPPYCYIENDATVGAPSEFLPARLLGDNLASLPGPAMPYWHFEQLLPAFARAADRYIAARAAAGQPFFLYLPMTSPHTPLSVNKRWIGASGLNNLYADLVMETDDVFGQVLDSLERHGVADDTLVIFTSDNGCAPYIGVDQMEGQGHHPSAGFRGYKSDAWDGGHRVPFIARWPGVIEPGSGSDQLVCLTDLLATCADFLEDPLPPDCGEDSVSMLPVFEGRDEPIRDHVVHHSISGKFAIRNQRWKLVLCPGSGGWTLDDAAAAGAGLPLVQLYDMRRDPAERHNLHAEQPAVVKEMVALLKRLVAAGRSTPGPEQSNDAAVDIWKADTLPGVDPAVFDDY